MGEPAIDLNLVPILLALLDAGSVRGAALQLGCGEGRIRRGLAVLRLTWADPLFLPLEGRLVPTAVAEAAGERLRIALEEIHRALEARDALSRRLRPHLAQKTARISPPRTPSP